MDKTESMNEYKILFTSLSVYADVLDDKVVKNLNRLMEFLSSDKKSVPKFIKKYNKFYGSLLKNAELTTFEDYLITKVLYADNLFTRVAEKEAVIDKSLLKAAKHDLKCLGKISKIGAKDIKQYAIDNICSSDFEKAVVSELPEWDFQKVKGKAKYDITETLHFTEDWSSSVELFHSFYDKNGTGVFAKYTGFVWEGNNKKEKLKGVENLDTIRFSDLTGYENERGKIVNNTIQFLKGYKANNALLYGDRGTGKSSTVKAILNEFAEEGLRIIEIPKAHLTDFPEILRIVKGRKQKFIFFVDDLVFGDNEESYTAMKAILEGGLETRPDNVLIYATSNRRHLIAERFSERPNGGSDDIHKGDTIQEKLSLADRFGITITFVSPDKLKYLKIVEDMAEKRGLDVDIETLHREALIWEMRYNGRSPRTARQFIDWLEGEVS